MKKVLIASCVTALLGGVTGAMIKVDTGKSETVENVTAVTPSVIPPAVPALVLERRPVVQSKTALLKVLSDKYADKLPTKVSGKVRRNMRKMTAQQSLNIYVRSLAFVRAERAKLGVKK